VSTAIVHLFSRRAFPMRFRLAPSSSGVWRGWPYTVFRRSGKRRAKFFLFFLFLERKRISRLAAAMRRRQLACSLFYLVVGLAQAARGERRDVACASMYPLPCLCFTVQ